MHSPLIPVAVAFIVGILFGEWMDVSLLWAAGVAVVALVVAALSLLFPVREGLCIVSVLLAVMFVAATWTWHCMRNLPSYHVKNFLPQSRTISKIRCRIVDHPLLRRQEPTAEWPFSDKEAGFVRTSCTVEVVEIHTPSGPRACSGRARLMIYDAARDLDYGDEILVSGFLSAPPEAENPGQFDYRRYLVREGIHALIIAPLRSNVRVIKQGGSLFWRAVYGLKGRMEAFVFTHCAEPQASVLSCLLLGNRTAVTREIEEVFQRTGTVHLLSVSGLHMALMAGSLWFILQAGRLPRKRAAFIVLAFVCYYTAMTGATAPPLRAGVMAAALCTGVLLGRPYQFMNSLGLAALVILLFDPGELFNVGFQLSFLCVLGIHWFYRPILAVLPGKPSPLDALEKGWRRHLASWLRQKVRQCVSLSASAQIMTAPLVAYQFHLFNPLAILHNLHILLIAWLVLAAGMVLVTAGTLLPWGASVMEFPLNALTVWFIRQIQITSYLDFAGGYVAGPSLGWMLAYFVLLLLVVKRERLRLSVGKLLILGLCLAAAPIWWWVFKPPIRDFQVTCLDVKHGNSLLLRFPGDRTLLFDCGSLGRYDVGRNVVAPYLWYEGITRLDALVISHGHLDHLNGVPGLLERVKVGTLVIGEDFGREAAGKDIVQLALKRRVEVIRAAAGDVLSLGDATVIRVLHPPPNAEITELLETNDRSLVLEVNSCGQQVLLTGDAGETVFKMMYDRANPARCDVAQIPHHGMEARVASLLAMTVRPHLALISAKDIENVNPTLNALRERGVLSFVTAQSGAIQVRFKTGRIRVRTFRDSKQ